MLDASDSSASGYCLSVSMKSVYKDCFPLQLPGAADLGFLKYVYEHCFPSLFLLLLLDLYEMEAEVCCCSGALISLQMGYDGRKVLRTCVSL